MGNEFPDDPPVVQNYLCFGSFLDATAHKLISRALDHEEAGTSTICLARPVDELGPEVSSKPIIRV